MQKYNKILLDVSNLFYRNHYVFSDMQINIDSTIIKTGGIWGFLRSLRKIEREYLSEDGKVYCLFDNATSKVYFRKDLDPDYKADRSKVDSSIIREMEYLALLLSNYSQNICLVQVPQREADDIPPVLISTFPKYDKILVVSDDMDFSRIIDTNVHWMQHNVIFTKETFKDKFEFEPSKESICIYKALKGDKSDNIQIGLKNIRKEILMRLIQYDGIEDLYRNIYSSGIDKKWIDLLIENKSRILLNYKLVDFAYIDRKELEEHIFQSEYNPATLRYYYKILGFDISKIDDRLLDTFPEKEQDSDFFGYEKIRRV